MVKGNLKIWLMIIIVVIFFPLSAWGAIRVVTEENQPINGAWLFVNLEREGTDMQPQHHRTDKTGSLDLNLPQGTVLTVYKNGYYPRTIRVSTHKGLIVKLKRVVRELSIGVVSTSDNNPVRGVNVRIGNQDITTDNRGMGRFLLDPSTRNVDVRATSSCEGSKTVESSVSFSEGEITKHLEIRIERGYSSLTARVVGGDNNPLMNKTFDVNDQKVTTDSRGRFSVRFPCGEVPKIVSVKAARPEEYCNNESAVSVKRRGDSWVAEEDARFIQRGINIEVINESNARVGDVAILRGNAEIGRTGPDGTAHISLCPGEEIILSKSSECYQDIRTILHAPPNRIQMNKSPRCEESARLTKCRELYYGMKYQDAMTICSGVINSPETRALYLEAHFYMGKANLMMGKIEQAENDFGEILRIDDNYAIANLEMGEMCQVKGDNEKALVYLRKALGRTQPLAMADVCRLYLNAGKAAHAIGRYDEADGYLRGLLTFKECPRFYREEANQLLEKLRRQP
jgi:hypothetical protein